MIVDVFINNSLHRELLNIEKNNLFVVIIYKQ